MTGLARNARRGALALLTLLIVVAAALHLAARAPRLDGPGGFDAPRFFSEPVVSHGQTRILGVRGTPFSAQIEPVRQGGESGHVAVREQFRFASGMSAQDWDLEIAADGSVHGTLVTRNAAGEPHPEVAVTGTADAEGMVLTYRGFAPSEGDRLFRFRHWMRAAADGTVHNHVVVSFAGLPFAVSTVRFALARDPRFSALSLSPLER